MNENSGSDVYVKVKELSQKDAAKSTTEDVLSHLKKRGLLD